MNDDDIKDVGIWLRVSTDMQAETDSIEHHEARARNYAESKGWNVARVYNLSGVSGKTVIDHPETQKMLNDIKSGIITGLIFSKLGRLARNTRELLDIADIFQEYNAGLISLQESIDTTTAGGRLFFTMLAATTQFERDEIASRVAASVPIRAEMGKPLGGQSPFGYVWEDKKLIPDEHEAPVRKLMYELFDEHKRKKKVARILNEMGYRTRGGKLFNDTSIDRLLRDTTAKGVHRRNYSKSRGKGKQWDYKDQKDWVYNEVEPIVSEKLWKSCNDYLDQQRAKIRKARGKTPKHIFSGVLKCYCGKSMYPYNSKSTYTCKACKNKIPILVLEEIFYEQLKSFVYSENDLQHALSQAQDYLDEKQQIIESMQNEIVKSKQQMDKVYKLYLEDKISGDGFKEKYSPLEDKVKALKSSIEEHERDLQNTQLSDISIEEVLKNGKGLADSWKSLNQEEKTQLVQEITEEIIISEDSIDIALSYAPLLDRGKRQRTNMGYKQQPA